MPDPIPAEAVQATLAHARSQPLLWQYISDPDIRELLEAAAPILRADERRKVAEELRDYARRLAEAVGRQPYKGITSVLLALADEIEGNARDSR